ncbi:MAG TPA: DoxX family protein [Vicinamibacteria bacterium]|nr:DoxX family protein [Vicinamibacteria bacterium]
MNRPSLDLALLVLRLAGLGLALFHGWGKLSALSAGNDRFVQGVRQMGFPAPLVFAWSAAIAETVGGTLVTLGLFARVAAALCAVTMFVAAFVRHHALDQLFVRVGLMEVPPERLTAWGNPELALLYLAAFLAIALAGAGALSVDGLRGGRRR